MTKRGVGSFWAGVSRLVKASVALAMCLGTLGVALTFVDALPAAAAGNTGVPTISSVSPPVGLPGGGTKVTIKGNNLDTPLSVDFGAGNPATVSSSSVGQIVIDSSPAGNPGTVDIIVTNTFGSSSPVPADEFTYAAAPTVTSLISGEASTSGGSSIIIQGTNFVSQAGVSSVLFATTAATSYTVVSNTVIQAGVPTMPVADTAGKLYNVTVTTGSGTSATGTLNQWYWFGTGTCGFSGPGVVNSGTSGPPGSSAYILDAVGNGLDSTTGTTTASSTTLTDPNASFNAGDVGETINIQSAGPSSSALVTTIAGFNSATSITLGTAASATINGDATYNYGTTAIDTNCTGFSNLLLLAPMIESLSDAVASAVTGTGAGGSVGGNESWLGWSGTNAYSTDSGTTYSGDYILPTSGPNTTGGCPLGSSTCSLAKSQGAAPYYGTDPQGTCPPTQAEANAGFVDCSIATLQANQSGNQYLASTIDISYADDPTPATPTASLSPSSGLSTGSTVTVTNCNSCNWWGAGAEGAPGFQGPVGQTGVAVSIPAPSIFVGATRATATAVPAADSSVTISPASYGCAASGGAATTSPGPTAACILGTSPVTGTSGTTTASSTAFSDPNASFYPSDVGLPIVITGAGAAGATLTTTIASVVSSTSVTLGTAASTAIAGTAIYTYGELTTQSTTGKTTASSTTFTDAHGTFNSSDVGKTIVISGAGPSGAPMDTSITAVASATSLTLAVAASTAENGTASYSYGAPGATGTATSGSTTFTDPHGSFTSGDVGQTIIILGAGASGTPLITTIAGFTSATSITLGTAASTTVSGNAIYNFGTPSQGTIKGSFTVPAGVNCNPCNVYIDEPNTTLTNGEYSGSTPYNGGLSYNLGGTINAVESSTSVGCIGSCGVNPPTVTGVSPTSGTTDGGTSVTITGTNFTGVTAVDFGATAATAYTVNSSTSITATTPAEAAAPSTPR